MNPFFTQIRNYTLKQIMQKGNKAPLIKKKECLPQKKDKIFLPEKNIENEKIKVKINKDDSCEISIVFTLHR